MKKIWKILCACSLVLTCSGGLLACGKDETFVSKDLDGDGVISSWETLYEDMEHTSDKNIAGEIIFISNADELLEINKHVDEQNIYVLNNNIDLDGREISINLGKSEFYGMNYVISNFKLATLNGKDISESGYENTYIKTLFRNGIGIFSTRLFMGAQSITIDNTERNSSYYISPLFNVPVISDIDVKGKISVNGKSVDNRISATVDASLLYTGMPMEKVAADEEVYLIEDITSIENVNVDGEIFINNKLGSRIGVNAGSIASVLSKQSIVYSCYAQAKINSTSAEIESAISGIVGHNKGFISSCTFTGEINLNNDAEMSVMYEGGINIGAIAGINDSLAEIKNSYTNAKITVTSAKEELSTASSDYYVGGIVGTNENGIIELCQSNAVISLKNLYSTFAGSMIGASNYGIISYNICRGSISATNIANISVAQVAGFAKNGLYTKMLITTPINIDNAGRTTEKLKIGMVTVFNDNETSPYFRRVVVDGISQVVTREIDNSKFEYKHGLRYPYQVQVGREEDKDVFDTILPDIFEEVYRTEGCKLYKYSQVAESKTEDIITINFANDKVNVVTITPYWMIDHLDFKNYLNHKEVSLDPDLNLNTLHFTIDDEHVRLQSYFADGKYNGELAYFDKEFDQSYNHTNNALGSCEHDKVDEMLSFVFDLIQSNNGRVEELYTIKVLSSYIDRDPNDNYEIDGLSADANIFIDKLCNVFGCLNTAVSVTRLDAYGKNLEDDETGNYQAKYVVISFSDSSRVYSMKIDISSMQESSSISSEAKDAFILFVTFSISSRIGV